MKERRRSGGRVWLRVLAAVVLLLAAAAAVVLGIGIYILRGIDRVPINEENLYINEKLSGGGTAGTESDASGGGAVAGTPAQEQAARRAVVNIAVFGVDTRDVQSFSGGADTVMIASIDREAGRVCLTSILRDSWIDVAGYGSMKLTDVYRRYGPEIMIQTLNRKFQMNIADYVSVNMYHLADAVDLIGGIELEITQAEMEQINRYSGSQELLTAAGDVRLNGAQAAMYARIRQIDSDQERVRRQRNVLVGIYSRVRELPAVRYPSILRTLLEMTETSMTYSEIVSYLPLLSRDLRLDSLTIPGAVENAYGGQNYPGLEGKWVWVYDYDTAAQNLYRFIYEDA
ncbi:MAG TPA: LCP family protein [Candidatus Onthovicinus excrementipullorum]|nr:LCP family protein [Candidatus Onthovicinus excrementipullorum]